MKNNSFKHEWDSKKKHLEKILPRKQGLISYAKVIFLRTSKSRSNRNTSNIKKVGKRIRRIKNKLNSLIF